MTAEARPVSTPVRCSRRRQAELETPDLSKKSKVNSVKEQSDVWLNENQTRIAEAEKLIHARWADPELMHEKMPLCEEVLKVMKAVLNSYDRTGSSPESKSVLVLGEAGSGKTQAVDWCLHKLRQEHPSLLALRARGGAYASNVECLRHLASQVAGQLISLPTPKSSFEDSMEWFRGILQESFKQDSAVVIVLDKFEQFCNLARQTLLYNLFNLAQDLSVRLCVVGISQKLNVTSYLEKRIMSRFSMHSLLAFPPRKMEELLEVMEGKLHLPEDCSLGPAFAQQFNERVSEALQLQAPCWQKDLELLRPPSWFLLRCLPVASFLRSSCGEESLKRPLTAGAAAPLAKRSRRCLSGVLGTSMGERTQILLSGLCECEHMVLLALLHLKEHPQRPLRNLGRVIHELMLLVDHANGVLTSHSEESFCAAFYRLEQLQLVRFSAATSTSSEVPKRYLACESNVDRVYDFWVSDLERSEPTAANNPLRSLPTPVQQWAVKMRS